MLTEDEIKALEYAIRILTPFNPMPDGCVTSVTFESDWWKWQEKGYGAIKLIRGIIDRSKIKSAAQGKLEGGLNVE